ncbi:MAG TPA: SRPBCC family protein [Candidatus Dormibacteraeota bacterium]
MELDNAFDVAAPPHEVYAFLLDVNSVAGCVPGAELSEVVDPSTFNGRVRIKVGPITVSYQGTARIVARDDEAHRAEIQAEGRETSGPGSARAHAVMTVTAAEGHSHVSIHTDYTVAGRVAQFGRGVMEDVSRRLVGQMADCIKQNLEGASSPPGGEVSPAAAGDGGGNQPRIVATAKPVNAFSLMFAVLWDRLRRLFGARPAQS